MPLYINGYKPTLSKEALIEDMENQNDMLDYEIDLLRVQLDHDQYDQMVSTAIAIKLIAQKASNIDLNIKELENGH